MGKMHLRTQSKCQEVWDKLIILGLLHEGTQRNNRVRRLFPQLSPIYDSLLVQAKDNLKVHAVHKMAVTTIVHYHNYLKEHLHPDSTLRRSSIWNNETFFKGKIAVKYPWDATDPTLEITGLPSAIVLLIGTKSMKRKMEDLLVKK